LLLRWLVPQLTLNRDTIRGRSKDPMADPKASRVYDVAFCPLLPQGVLFVAALGHFRRNAEYGWRLAQAATESTKTGGGRPAGLIHEAGLEWKPGMAHADRAASVRDCLEALRTVVEGLGGVLACRLKDGRWLGVAEARESLPPEELAKAANWFPFLRADWIAIIRRRIEDNSAERHLRGESPYVVRVTTDPAEKAAAEERRLGIADDANPMAQRNRMALARKNRKLTQAAVAALFDVSQPAYSCWESGKKPIPMAMEGLVERWIMDGTAPTEDELREARE
jgi:hypothetical protein